MARSWKNALPLVMLISLLSGMVFSSFIRWNDSSRLLGIATVFFGSLYFLWLPFEGRITIRDVKESDVKSDRGTLELYGISQGVTVLCGFLFAPNLPSWWLFQLVAGACAFSFGILIRIWAVLSLGRHYSHKVRLLDEHAIVKTGHYRWIRHPAYLGMILIHCSIALAFPSIPVLIAFVFLLLPAIVLRIFVEEKKLMTIPAYVEFAT